jgi:sterol desaturase/sphingolipid hydroxylase (fatty acid hydroxylase superfamily)
LDVPVGKYLVMIDYRLVFLGGMLILSLALEKIWPLRKITQTKTPRVMRNLGLAAVAAAVTRFIFYPIVIQTSLHTQSEGWGIVPLLGLPRWANVLLLVVLFDYTLFIWHWLIHRIGFLWRFHNVHHVDLDVDVSTASRFHFGELALSSFFRSTQVIIFGADLASLMIFELTATFAAQFHHSNLALPKKVDDLLKAVIVTPRMHGVHHSIVREETDSNFGTIFSIWDRLHGTFKANIPQDQITIGVAAYRDPQELTFLKSLALPFQKQRSWKLPNGTVPKR